MALMSCASITGPYAGITPPSLGFCRDVCILSLPEKLAGGLGPVTYIQSNLPHWVVVRIKWMKGE